MHQDSPWHLWRSMMYMIYTFITYVFTLYSTRKVSRLRASSTWCYHWRWNWQWNCAFCFFLQFVSLQVFRQGIVMPGAESYFTSHSLYIKDWSHPQRSFFITKSVIRSQAVAYPHLNMSLQLKSIYTRAELEQRCKNAKRRRHAKIGKLLRGVSPIHVRIYIYIYVASGFRMFYGQRRVGKSYSI